VVIKKRKGEKEANPLQLDAYVDIFHMWKGKGGKKKKDGLMPAAEEKKRREGRSSAEEPGTLPGVYKLSRSAEEKKKRKKGRTVSS